MSTSFGFRNKTFAAETRLRATFSDFSTYETLDDRIIYNLICKYIQFERIIYEKSRVFALTRQTAADIIIDKLLYTSMQACCKEANNEQDRF